MIEPTEGVFQGAGGLKHFYQRWEAEQELQRGTLAMIHGPGSFGGIFTTLARYFASHGYNVYGFEHRAHHQSPRQRGFEQEWHDSRQDVRVFLQLVLVQEPGRPLFLLGNDLGATIAMTYALHASDDLSGVIVLGPEATRASSLSSRTTDPPLIARLSQALLNIWPQPSLTDTKGAASDVQIQSIEPSSDDDEDDPRGTDRIRVQTADLPLPNLVLYRSDAESVGSREFREEEYQPILRLMHVWIEERL